MKATFAQVVATPAVTASLRGARPTAFSCSAPPVALRPAAPVRLVLMSSVSVSRPARADTRRGVGERAFTRVVRALLPPARDNQRAADLLSLELGADAPVIEWVVVRPDSLVDGEVSTYRIHDGIVSSLVRPDRTRFANVAHFMAELVTDASGWRRWWGRMPVIVDDPATETA